MRLLRVLVLVVILLVGGLAGYAYFGDMKSDPQETRLPVELDLGSAPAAPAVAVSTAATAAPQSAPQAAQAIPAAATGAGQDALD